MPSSARALASGPGVDRAARGDLPGELEHERLRLGVVAADERVLVRRLLAAEVRGRERVEAGDHRPVDARPGSWPRSTSPRPSGKTPSFVNESSAATESTGVVPIASRSERAVSTAPSAFVVRTTRSAARAASSFVAPSTLLDRRARRRRPGRARRRASRSRRRSRLRGGGRRAPCRSSRCLRQRDLHERASIAASRVVWASRRAASRSVMSVSVTTRPTSPSASARCVGARRSRARRAGPCNTLSHGSGSSRRRAAASSGRAGRGRRGRRSAG